MEWPVFRGVVSRICCCLFTELQAPRVTADFAAKNQQDEERTGDINLFLSGFVAYRFKDSSCLLRFVKNDGLRAINSSDPRGKLRRAVHLGLRRAATSCRARRHELCAGGAGALVCA